MEGLPATRYARNGDAHLAYQVVGDGPLDLVLVESWARYARGAVSPGAVAHCYGQSVRTDEVEVRGEQIGGLTVHIGARVAAVGGGGEIVVSSTVKDLMAVSGSTFGDRGEHELEGVPGTWHLYTVEP